MKLDYNFLHLPIGWILLVTEHNRLCWLSMGDEKMALLDELQQSPYYRHAQLEQNTQLSFEQAKTLELAPKGTAWQQQVWRALLGIPVGSTITYSQLAERCNKPGAARAVASACAKNPIAWLIPCHRVIAKSGALSGYRWGLQRKQWLLNGEKA